MATEWIVPVTTTIMGLATVGATAWTTGRGRRHDRELAVDRQRHERFTAHEQWIRDRREDAYVSLIDLAEESGLYVQRVHPMWDSNPPRPVPDLPDLEAQRKVRARVIAFGSQKVKDRMGEWQQFVHRAIYAAAAVTDDVDGARQQLHDLRDHERQARQALGDQVAAELQENSHELNATVPRAGFRARLRSRCGDGRSEGVSDDHQS